MNVNVTLLFAIDRYEQVIGSFLRGLTARAEAGEPLSSVASVASFFLSRIDTKTDAQLPAESQLRGRVAIASARVPYQLQAQSSPAQIGSASNRSELSGVPFQLRTSKALAQSRHTVTRGFKQPARRLFRLPDDASLAARPNEISFELSEPGVIWIDFLAKQPGASMDLGAAT